MYDLFGDIHGHADALTRRFPDVFGDAEVGTFEGTDDARRLFVPNVVWTIVAARFRSAGRCRGVTETRSVPR